MDNRIEIFSGKFNNIKISLMGIFMTIMSAVIILIGFCSGSILYKVFTFIFGAFGVLFFGAGTLFCIKNIFIIKPTLILDNDGFYENSSIVSMKNTLISWDSVSKIKNMPMMGQGMVSIFMKDQEAYLDKLPIFKRLITKMNLALGYGEITINMNQIQNMDGEELTETMNEYRKNHRNKSWFIDRKENSCVLIFKIIK